MKYSAQILIVLLAIVFSDLDTIAQGNQNQSEKVTVTMIIGDFRYIRSEFDAIEITAKEVDALLSIRKNMDNILNTPLVLEKKDYESLTVDIIKSMATNILIFMDRMTIQGKDAEKFQRFRDALRKSVSVN